MTADWQDKTWGDIATLEYGKGLREYSGTSGQFPVFGTNGQIGWYKEALYEGPSVIVGRKGAYRGIQYSETPFFVIDTAFYLKPKITFDMKWAYYELLTRDINSMDSGSAIPSTNRDEFHSLHVRIPPLPEQRRIALILGTLDDKIENNRKTAKTLEAMAQAIFKSWFVDFDPVRAKMSGESRESIRKRLKVTPEILDLFPDRLVDSELGEIPEGWEVKPLGELVNIIKGRSYKSDELSDSETALVTLKSFARGGGYRVDGLKPFTGTYKPEQLLNSGDMLIACTDVTQAAEVIGRPIIIRKNAKYHNLVASLDTIIVRPMHPSLNSTFLYYLCATDLFVGHTSTYVTGTTVLHLGKEAILSFRFAFATHKLVEIFQITALPLLKQIDIFETESEHLMSLRDILLPKLISGEIRVPDRNLIVGDSIGGIHKDRLS
ncbi:restriction endonuclease subunit S [Acidithiobacillus caldus]